MTRPIIPATASNSKGWPHCAEALGTSTMPTNGAKFKKQKVCLGGGVAVLDEAGLLRRDLVAALLDFDVGHVDAHLGVDSFTNNLAPDWG